MLNQKNLVALLRESDRVYIQNGKNGETYVTNGSVAVIDTPATILSAIAKANLPLPPTGAALASYNVFKHSWDTDGPDIASLFTLPDAYHNGLLIHTDLYLKLPIGRKGKEDWVSLYRRDYGDYVPIRTAYEELWSDPVSLYQLRDEQSGARQDIIYVVDNSNSGNNNLTGVMMPVDLKRSDVWESVQRVLK